MISTSEAQLNEHSHRWQALEKHSSVPALSRTACTESWVSQCTRPTVSHAQVRLMTLNLLRSTELDMSELDRPVTYFSDMPNTHVFLQRQQKTRMLSNFETVAHALNTEEADDNLESAVHIRKIPLQLHMSIQCYGSLKTLHVWLYLVSWFHMFAGGEERAWMKASNFLGASCIRFIHSWITNVATTLTLTCLNRCIPFLRKKPTKYLIPPIHTSCTVEIQAQSVLPR